ncbi:MAG: protein kinase, partial [Polyangiaceae bacterium]|nr:protein kinase [Polyangiaceae bacterium]
PGIRAQIFRRARRQALSILERHGEVSPSALQDLPYRIAPGRELSHALLQAIRIGLPEETTELLELHFARELTIEELAFVLEVSEARASAELADAVARCERLVRGRAARERGIAALVVDALALVPATNREAAEDAEGWESLPFGTIIGGRYATAKRVGSGAFGDVYQANDTEVPGHVVALKLLHHAAYGDDARQSALRELRLIASVFHPSVVQFKDHGWHEGRLWFVMPWYEGETLERRIEREPLGRAEALAAFQPLARALAAMHAAGVRHQDVKPDNVFLAKLPGSAGHEILPVLLDLGVAATEAEIVVAGTPTYFAPEVAAQFSGKQSAPPITLKADVFSLALALRNALEPSTKSEVRGGAVEAFIAERAERPPAPPSDPDLRFLAPSFRRWMSLDPDERPTAEELAEELEVLVLPERRRRRRKALFAAVAPIVALATILVVTTFA